MLGLWGQVRVRLKLRRLDGRVSVSGGDVLTIEVTVCVSSILLGHGLNHEDILASDRLLDLYPRFYGNR